nr:adenylate/guanylate cyclase domain-containing protein [Mucilaginibacter sp. OK268]
MVNYFENQQSARLVMLFIDITGFSTKCKEFTNSELAKYLNAYYDLIIPAIYALGGEIEKIMGDGIIAIFGEPFLQDNIDTLFEKADQCAKNVVMLTKGTNKQVKVAIHEGNIMYYKNKSINYPEYTIIGRPLTELYRLESVAKDKSISFYRVSQYDNKSYTQSNAYCLSGYSRTQCEYFTKSGDIEVSLPGVDWHYIKHLTCTT